MVRIKKKADRFSPLCLSLFEYRVYDISIQKPSHSVRHIPLEDRLSDYTVSEPYEEFCSHCRVRIARDD